MLSRICNVREDLLLSFLSYTNADAAFRMVIYTPLYTADLVILREQKALRKHALFPLFEYFSQDINLETIEMILHRYTTGLVLFLASSLGTCAQTPTCQYLEYVCGYELNSRGNML